MVGRPTFDDFSPELQAYVTNFTANEKIVYERAIVLAEAHKKRV
jgi:hypothetical protein